jgi:hypothetical protein
MSFADSLDQRQPSRTKGAGNRQRKSRRNLSPRWLGMPAKQLETAPIKSTGAPDDPDEIDELAPLIAHGLRRFESEFGDPYGDRGALTVYRSVANLIEERGSIEIGKMADPSMRRDPHNQPQ